MKKRFPVVESLRVAAGFNPIQPLHLRSPVHAIFLWEPLVGAEPGYFMFEVQTLIGSSQLTLGHFKLGIREAKLLFRTPAADESPLPFVQKPQGENNGQYQDEPDRYRDPIAVAL